MKRGCGGEPREEGGVLHRVPRPVAAPTEHLVSPPAASTIATVRKIQGRRRKLRSGRMKSWPSRPTRSAAQARPKGIVIPTYPE